MYLSWIFWLAVIGLIDSLFLYYKKKRKEKLVCFIGSDCNKVIRSKYATTFGIENTLLGMLYYAGLIAAVYFAPPSYSVSFAFLSLLMKIVTSIAGIMSAYLLMVQVFILKEWCDYCLLSAVVNFAIIAAVFL